MRSGKKNAYGGIVITASHNPKEYNGYKVYAGYGGQLPPRESKQVLAYIDRVDIFDDVKTMDVDKAVQAGRIKMIGKDVDNVYFDHILSLSFNKEVIEKHAKDLKIVYTPLYGTGLYEIKNVLPALGYTKLYIVQEQAVKDSDFPTVDMPNPEDKTAMVLAEKLAHEKNADLILGTDPDADRLGVMIKDPHGGYLDLSGNQIGCLLLDYILKAKKQKGEPGGYVVKSIVSTNLADRIAAHYHVDCYAVLTGFRFISEMIENKQQTNETFLFGFEESHGFLAGTFVREKAAVVAASVLCEAACFYRNEQKSLYDALVELYERFGWHEERVIAHRFDGLDGMQRIQDIQKSLRANPIKSLGGKGVVSTADYFESRITYADKAAEEIDTPKSDVLYYTLEDGCWVCVRPSGTEPKLKVYLAGRAGTQADAEKLVGRMESDIKKRLKIK